MNDQIRIYNEDALKILEDKSFHAIADCVVTDPPYPLTSGGSRTGTLGGVLSKENYSNNGKIVDCEINWNQIATIAHTLLKNDTHCYLMSNNRNIKDMWQAAEDAGLYFHNLLVWIKHNTTPNKFYMKNAEFTGFFKKGKAKTINIKGSQSAIKVLNNKQTSHPTEKPVDLMKVYILNSTNEGDLVVDPFCGTGSTAIACLETNRRFIGFEKDPKHYKECLERVNKWTASFQH